MSSGKIKKVKEEVKEERKIEMRKMSSGKR